MQEKSFSGIIIRGLGEGAYFMSMQHYKNEIRKKLGFDAYPGTLNLKAGKKQIEMVKKSLSIRIGGCRTNGKTFGGAGCRRARIKNIDGAIIVPDLGKHKDILEFIAPIHLKSELNLKDNDKIKVELI
ncbi:CTP-dependent riboflavin kinase [Candidatus Woesearchaeota archaeon]|nr:CTP-dependent riboflavin kinase [Candidatus Woesearchaeota archaeon]